MSSTAVLMTAEEMLSLPDNGVERWLVAGELRERPLTFRNRVHSRVLAVVTSELMRWEDAQPEPHGNVLTGDAGIRISRNPDTVFGVDLVYVAAAVLIQQSARSTIVEGLPALCVEILSPSDKQEEIDEKTEAFLAAGVPLVWIINPRLRTILALRPQAEPALFNVRETLSGEPELPGFHVPVAQLFR